MSAKVLFIKVGWDPKTKVWFIDSTNIPGLNAEAESREDLLIKLDDLVPELLKENGVLDGGDLLPEIILYGLMFHQLRTMPIDP